MPSFIGRQGKTYTVVEPPLGKGGEGAVYRIAGMTDYVLKVFQDSKRTETRHRKLLTMVSTPLSPSAMQQVTWPVDVVYQNNSFAGYVMPAIKNNEDLNVMYSDKYVCTLSEKITIGMNLCAAINAVHNAGQVCGDLNPKNIGVDPQSARITLVDTDSYHITDKNNSRVYRCEVGLPEYLPREIQEKMKHGQTLSSVSLPTFTQATDLFALAVHIFALLMNGCHPFACAINNKTNIGLLSSSHPSVAAPQPIDNICNGFFPFYSQKAGITTPKYAPPFSVLPKNIQDLFVRAFVLGHNEPSKRPDSVEWYNALSEYKQNLTHCPKEKSHMYSNHLSKCPWCELETNMRVPIIPPPPASPVNYIAQKTNTTSYMPANTNYNTATGAAKRKDGIMASEGMFWMLTIGIPLLVQAVVQINYGDAITSALFGSSYGSGVEYWGADIGIWLGPWGFVILGIVGTLIYNFNWCNSGSLYGYQWYHYVLSCLVSFAFSASYILLMLVISIAIVIIFAILVIVFVCGVISGS